MYVCMYVSEPMLTEGDASMDVWVDGWTMVTTDAGRSAQYEHTLAVTDSGVEVLTDSDTESGRRPHDDA